MIQRFVRHKIADPAWRARLAAALDFRHRGGDESCRLFRDAEPEGVVTLLFVWEFFERRALNVRSTELKEKMQQAGITGTPEVRFLAQRYTIRRRAPDHHRAVATANFRAREAGSCVLLIRSNSSFVA